MNYINTDVLRVGTAAALADKVISWRALLGHGCIGLGSWCLVFRKNTYCQIYMTVIVNICVCVTGTFKDGHDDVEVIEYRQQVYLPLMQKWRAQAVLPADYLNEQGEYEGDLQSALEKARARAQANRYDKILLIHSHDDCSFNSNDTESWRWDSKDDQRLTPKSRGALINVGDWSNTASGWLKLTDEQFKYAKAHHAYDVPQEAVVRLEIDGNSPWWDIA
jgi:hypothetical protein